MELSHLNIEVKGSKALELWDIRQISIWLLYLFK